MFARQKFHITILVLLISLFVIVFADDSTTVSSQAAGKITSPSKPSSSSSSSFKQQSQSAIQRQAPGSMIATIGAILPALVTQVAPLLLLVGIGALVAPALGMGALGLLREGRRSFNEFATPSFGQLSNLAAFGNAAPIRPHLGSPQEMYFFQKRSLSSSPSMSNFGEALKIVAQRVIQALENADQKY